MESEPNKQYSSVVDMMREILPDDPLFSLELEEQIRKGVLRREIERLQLTAYQLAVALLNAAQVGWITPTDLGQASLDLAKEIVEAGKHNGLGN